MMFFPGICIESTVSGRNIERVCEGFNESIATGQERLTKLCGFYPDFIEQGRHPQLIAQLAADRLCQNDFPHKSEVTAQLQQLRQRVMVKNRLTPMFIRVLHFLVANRVENPLKEPITLAYTKESARQALLDAIQQEETQQRYLDALSCSCLTQPLGLRLFDCHVTFAAKRLDKEALFAEVVTKLVSFGAERLQQAKQLETKFKGQKDFDHAVSEEHLGDLSESVEEVIRELADRGKTEVKLSEVLAHQTDYLLLPPLIAFSECLASWSYQEPKVIGEKNVENLLTAYLNFIKVARPKLLKDPQVFLNEALLNSYVWVRQGDEKLPEHWATVAKRCSELYVAFVGQPNSNFIGQWRQLKHSAIQELQEKRIVLFPASIRSRTGLKGSEIRKREWEYAVERVTYPTQILLSPSIYEILHITQKQFRALSKLLSEDKDKLKTKLKGEYGLILMHSSTGSSITYFIFRSPFRVIVQSERRLGKGAAKQVNTGALIYGELFQYYRSLALGTIDDPQMKQATQQEFALIKKLGKYKGYFIGASDFVQIGEKYLLAMDFCNQGTLDQFVMRQGKGLTKKRKTQMFVHLIQAILHGILDEKLAFNDLKPENVLVADNVPIVSDFGTVKPLKEVSPDDYSLSGTKQYFAPEVAQGQQRDFVAKDIWALGCLLWFLEYGEICPVVSMLSENKTRWANQLKEPLKGTRAHLIWQMLRPDLNQRIKPPALREAITEVHRLVQRFEKGIDLAAVVATKGDKAIDPFLEDLLSAHRLGLVTPDEALQTCTILKHAINTNRKPPSQTKFFWALQELLKAGLITDSDYCECTIPLFQKKLVENQALRDFRFELIQQPIERRKDPNRFLDEMDVILLNNLKLPYLESTDAERRLEITLNNLRDAFSKGLILRELVLRNLRSLQGMLQDKSACQARVTESIGHFSKQHFYYGDTA
ncbi:MAG: protein kinase, partial [Chlamydiia bacterium]|nr:protein kinase [Chlamydiia bacterium]